MERPDPIIDGDGHVFEHDQELYPYLPSRYPEGALRNYYLFPTLDGWRRGSPAKPFGADAQGWLRFMDYAGISQTVLYPTTGLGFGFAKDPVWAADLARAYNTYISEHFLKVSPRLKGVALLPVQDPQAAARELHRAVTELGQLGGLLPAVGLRQPYGDRAYDPLYQEAQGLGVMLAVHGAPRQGVGIDFIEDPDQAFVLAHPFSVMAQFTSMVCERVFDRFPRLKVAFLEAGCGWVPFLMERIDHRMERRSKGKLASEQVLNHPIYFHAELEERQPLATALSVVGEEHFIYASDYPHETAESILQALQDFLAREDLGQAAKRRILCDNVRAMYGMG